LKYARKSGAANVFALDVYPYLDTSELENTGIKYLVYNGQQMPFKNNSFDFIWSNDTFEHIRHPELTVSELSRILKPGAKVVLNIDLSDHYTKGMSESLLFKCLKYPGWLWKMMTGNRSAYVNRLRYSDWMHLIQKSGLKPIGENLLQSSEIRDLYRNKQIGYLKNLSEADAVTFYMSVVIEKPLS
jgi:ubiquinone/menaquinone biosynthesis C-methylase UbiE